MTRIPLSYANPDLRLRANWPAAVSLACVTVFPIAYGLAPRYFVFFRGVSTTQTVYFNSVWVVSGLAAALFGLVGLLRSTKLRLGGRRIALAGLLMGLINLAAVPGLSELKTQHALYDHESPLRCQNHMKSVGIGIMLYANENQGRFPDRLEELILTQEISPDSFVCPLSNDVAAFGPTTQAVADNLGSGGHLSYVYVGKGMRSPTDPKLVVLYERVGNHAPHSDSVNFLFADGHVDRFSQRQAEKMIEQLKAGINPPKP